MTVAKSQAQNLSAPTEVWKNLVLIREIFGMDRREIGKKRTVHTECPQSGSLDLNLANVKAMRVSKLETIEEEVRKLPLAQAVELQDWLAIYLEDSAELNPAFVDSINRGQADLQNGRMVGASKAGRSFDCVSETIV